jgi:hypothetical protein
MFPQPLGGLQPFGVIPVPPDAAAHHARSNRAPARAGFALKRSSTIGRVAGLTISSFAESVESRPSIKASALYRCAAKQVILYL